MRLAREFHQLDERAQKMLRFAGVVGCAGLFQQPARADIHSLFDQGLIEFTSEYRVKLSNRFEEPYPNSTEYISLNGKKILLPD